MNGTHYMIEAGRPVPDDAVYIYSAQTLRRGLHSVCVVQMVSVKGDPLLRGGGGINTHKCFLFYNDCA